MKVKIEEDTDRSKKISPGEMLPDLTEAHENLNFSPTNWNPSVDSVHNHIFDVQRMRTNGQSPPRKIILNIFELKGLFIGDMTRNIPLLRNQFC
jgi:hypothetical protein